MKILKYVGIAVLVLGALWAAAFFIKSNSKSPITFDSETPFEATIEKKTVATGKVVPEDEIEIKPQISGIIDKVYLEEGVQVKAGDLIATVKVVPNEQSLNSARGRIRNAEINLNNVQIEYNRNKALFEKGVISSQDFNTQKLRFEQATQELKQARSDYQIVKVGSAGGSSVANTYIRATVPGTLLTVPVEKGSQVIQSNNFNAGTSIATIADLSNMIFEGKVDEAEVGKLKIGMPLKVSLGAIEDKEFDAKLRFVAPKGDEESGAVQFKIEGDVTLDDDYFVRAGYSANASIVLETKKDVLSVKEAWLQHDKETDEPYVEVEVGEQKFERRDIKVGISDGINVEILEGLTKEDKVKVWNKTEPKKRNDDKKENNN
ncbi:MAG: efflux RND transporter periplasmic adaptor subunit [Flavobacteriaceae bacterium]|nr:efflux RND transporter periplasmic adaptor subunit [Flavobacteriaceae bacterium]